MSARVHVAVIPRLRARVLCAARTQRVKAGGVGVRGDVTRRELSRFTVLAWSGSGERCSRKGEEEQRKRKAIGGVH